MTYNRELITLDNRLRVILDHRPQSQSFAASCMVHVGALNDYKKRYGLAHFTEHFLFRSKIEDSSVYVEDLLRTYGGEIGGETGTTFTHYYVSSHKTDSLQAIKYLEKIVCDLNIDEKLLSREKELISEEMDGDIDWSYWSRHKLSLMGFPDYVVHPTIGTRYSLKNITISDIQKFYNEFYTPDNIVLSIVGNFNRKEIMDFVNKYFLSLPKTRSKKAKKIQIQIEGPKINSTSGMFWGNSFKVYFVTKAFENADLPAAELLNGYIDLQMHKNFRMKKEQLYHIGCDLDYEYNIGCLEFYFRCKHKKQRRVLFDFLKDLKVLKNNCLEERMLETIKNKLIKKQLIMFEDVFEAAQWYSYRELLTSRDHPNDVESYLKAFDDITCESIKDFSRRLFIPENFFLDYEGYLNKKTKEEIITLLE